MERLRRESVQGDALSKCPWKVDIDSQTSRGQLIRRVKGERCQRFLIVQTTHNSIFPQKYSKAAVQSEKNI